MGLIEALMGRREKTRGSLEAEYRQLLARHDRLGHKEIERLDDVAQTLGHTPEIVATHIAAIKEAGELMGKPRNFEEARQVHKATAVAITNLEAEIERQRRENEAKRKTLSKARHQQGIDMQAANANAERLAELRQQYPTLFT